MSRPLPRPPVPLLLLLALFGCRGYAIPGAEGLPWVLSWEVDPDAAPTPYGFWGLNGYLHPAGLGQVQDRFNATVFNSATRHPADGVGVLLPMVRDAGMSVNLRMVGDHGLYTKANGDFDLDAWKGRLDLWADSGVQEFIDDGTLAYHMLLDDIDTFEGRDPTAADLDEMARYSKELLPGLEVLVRQDADRLPMPQSGRFDWLDACVNQYRADAGTVEIYAFRQHRTATALGLDIVFGLNIANGGDGSSGQPGWAHGFYAMSGEEIRDYGAVLTAAPNLRLFLNWEYDGEEPWADGTRGADWFDQPDQADALLWLGDRLAREPGVE